MAWLTRAQQLKQKYGITEADYEKMLKDQGEVCAICKRHQRFQRLAVDHDHKTKKVRGLLCMSCNRGLGRFFDSAYRLRAAADYLDKFKAPAQIVSTRPSWYRPEKEQAGEAIRS